MASTLNIYDKKVEEFEKNKNESGELNEYMEAFSEYLKSRRELPHAIVLRAAMDDAIKSGKFVDTHVYRMNIEFTIESMVALDALYPVKEHLLVECMQELGFPIDVCSISDYGCRPTSSSSSSDSHIVMWEVAIGNKKRIENKKESNKS